MTEPPLTEDEFNTQTEELKIQREEAIEKFNDFISSASSLDFSCIDGSWFSDVTERVDEAVAEIQAAVAEFIEVSLELLSPGNPFWFYNAAANWRDARTALSSEQFSINQARTTRLPSTDSWNDDQVKWYGPMPDAQNTAIEELKARCRAIEDASLDHTVALTNGWVNLLTGFSELHSWVITTVAGFISADPLKWLDIVPQVVGCLVELKDLVVGFVADLLLAWTDARDLVAGLKGDFADNASLDGGRWPTIESFA